MSENKFTPGPWEYGFGEGISGHRASFTVYLADSGCKEIPIKVKGSSDMICIIPFDLDEDAAMADASLIAAAPELLEALEQAVNAFYIDDPEWADAMYRLIAKAKGEES